MDSARHWPRAADPGLLLVATGLAVGFLFFGLGAVLGSGPVMRTAGIGVGAVIVATLCVTVPIMLLVGLLSHFAYRACMLESTGVWASYRCGWQVLTAHVGPALIIFVLQLAIQIGLGVVLFVPGLLMALCCLLWPVLIAIQGAITAYFSTVWTLAWREWTRTEIAPA